MKNAFLTFTGLILYRLSLDLAYPVISGLYAYTGLKITDDAMHPFISWGFFLCSLPPALFLLQKTSLLSIMTGVLYLIGFVPTTSLFMYMDPDPFFVISYLLYWTFFLVFACFFAGVRNTCSGTGRDHSRFFYCSVLFLSTVVIYISWKYRGLSFHFNLDDVYKLRRDSSLDDVNILFKYILGWANKLLPVVTVYFLWKKQWKWFAGMLAVVMLNFAISGHKSIFFGVLLGIVICLFYRNWMWSLFPLMLSFLNFTGILLCESLGHIHFISYLTRRVMFVPALLNYCYYDHFSTHVPDYMSSGILGKIFNIESQYPDGIPRFIGLAYWNKKLMAANNGLFSDAYANFGLIGCVIMPFFLIVAICFLQYCCRNLPPRVYFSFIVVFGMSVISSFLSTIILTHGLVIAYIFCYLMPSGNNLNTVSPGQNELTS